MLLQFSRRLGLVIIGTWLITSALFLLSRGLTTPYALADEDVTPYQPEQRATREMAYRQRLGLQAPLFYCSVLPWQWHGIPNQYHAWLRDLRQGHLGVSYRDGTPVEDNIRRALGTTLPLTLTALALSGALALGTALIAARRPGLYRWLMPAAYALDSLPLFVVAVLLLLFLANPDLIPLFPAFGPGPALNSGEPMPSVLLAQAYHMVLPICSLVLVSMPTLFLPTVEALRLQWQQPYVATALAKGVPASVVWRRHVLPNVAPLFFTRLSDLLPGVVAGAVVVEVVFALPGMGRLLAEAAAARDSPVLIGGMMLVAATRLLAWLLSDQVHVSLDPRLR